MIKKKPDKILYLNLADFTNILTPKRQGKPITVTLRDTGRNVKKSDFVCR